MTLYNIVLTNPAPGCAEAARAVLRRQIYGIRGRPFMGNIEMRFIVWI